MGFPIHLDPNPTPNMYTDDSVPLKKEKRKDARGLPAISEGENGGIQQKTSQRDSAI